MATTINGDLLVTGSVVANQNVQAGQVISVNEDVGSGRNITAVNDIVAANNVEAGNIISAHVDVGAGHDVVAQNDVNAGHDLTALNQIVPLTTPTAPSGTSTAITLGSVFTTPTGEPGLVIKGTDGNFYALVLDVVTVAGVTTYTLDLVLQP